MNILIDTHIALWSLYEDKKLSKKAKGLLLDSNNTIYYSLASAWEVEIKHSIGKLSVPADAFIEDCDSIGFLPLSIKKEHILGLKDLPLLPDGHKDPFDRLLLTQARSERMAFLTLDKKILAYGEKQVSSITPLLLLQRTF